MSAIALRLAVLRDVPAIHALIALSAHGLGRGDYSKAQIDAALKGVFGVDTQLIRDQTYFVFELRESLIGCGGWSFRETLFGSDDRPDRNPRRLNPTTEAARIRAFFIHPNYARKGLGGQLLAHCERAAQAHGFGRAALGATVSGERLYRAFGYQSGIAFDHPMPGGEHMRVIPMEKSLNP